MEEKKEKEKIEADQRHLWQRHLWKIPECCIEGWKNCPHVAKKKRKVKKNIGL